jgi:predicted  nucleic acid-binding Zn-ribbon protein
MRGWRQAELMVGSNQGNADELKALEKELKEKSLALASLEVMIEDYRRERSRLLEELMSLRERLWDLTGQEQDSDDKDEMNGD